MPTFRVAVGSIKRLHGVCNLGGALKIGNLPIHVFMHTRNCAMKLNN